MVARYTRSTSEVVLCLHFTQGLAEGAADEVFCTSRLFQFKIPDRLLNQSLLCVARLTVGIGDADDVTLT
jgi:hypothetical protein